MIFATAKIMQGNFLKLLNFNTTLQHVFNTVEIILLFHVFLVSLFQLLAQIMEVLNYKKHIF